MSGRTPGSWVGRRLMANGVEHWYEVGEPAGPPNGRTVLLLHGMLTNGSSLDTIAEMLETAGYRTVRPDFRGHRRDHPVQAAGRAVPPLRDGGGFTMELLAQDVIAFIEALRCAEQPVDAPFSIVGYSMGGFVALRVAATRGDLVERLVLLASSAEPESPGRRRGYGARVLGLHVLPRRWAAFLAAFDMLGTTTIGGRICPWLPLPRPLRPTRRRGRRIASVLGRTMALHDWRTMQIVSRAVIDRLGLTPVERRAIQAPTRLIAASEDTIREPAELERTRRSIPAARDKGLFAILSAGHLCLLERPRRTARVVLEALREDRTA